mgnify:CR=1 FL=1
MLDINDLNLIAKELTKDFVYFKNKKIFLTGGTGFFGKWILESIRHLNVSYELNIDVTILTRSPMCFEQKHPHLAKHSNFRFVKGDFTTFESIESGYDIVIHAATDVSIALAASDSDSIKENIIDGAKNICKLANNSNCSKILYISSGAVYGTQTCYHGGFTEDTVLNDTLEQHTSYSLSKLESEREFLNNSNCDVIIARCFTFLGPYLPLDGNFAAGNFISDLLNGKDIKINGDGSPLRSYLYMADLVIWLLRILSKGQVNEIYNVGSPVPISIKDLARKISGKNSVIMMNDINSKNNNYVPCVKKAMNNLNLKEYTNLDVAIEKTIKFSKLERNIID